VLSDLEAHDGASMPAAALEDRAGRLAHGVPLPREAPWPRQMPLPPDDATTALPVPAQNVFEIPEKSFAAIAPATHRVRQPDPTSHDVETADAGDSRRTFRGRHSGHIRHAAMRGTRHAAHARRGALKHLVQVKRRSV
jgi:peptidoglycan-N-acetylglucosamine deacetylase